MSQTAFPLTVSHLAAAQTALRDGRLVDAEAGFAALSRDEPERAAGLAGLAQVAQARRDWNLALARWDDCLCRFPADTQPGWSLARGWALLNLGAFARAETAFAPLAAGASPPPAVLLGHAVSVMYQARWADAVPLWDRLCEAFPAQREAEWLLGRVTCLLEAGQVDRAGVACAELLAVHPALAMAHHAHVRLYTFIDEPEAAAQASARALRVAPGHPLLLLQAAGVAIRRDDLPGARTALRAALAAADAVPTLEQIFTQAPSLFEGWALQSLRLDLDRRLGAMAAPTADAAALALRVRLALRDHDGFVALIDRAPPGDADAWSPRLRAIARTLRAARFPDFAAPKVFGIGLTKTGTTTLTRALELLGLHAAHYVNDLTGELLDLDDAALFDAMSDTPVCAMFETLYHMYPNARFIYTVRPVASWLDSFTDHYRCHFRSTGFDDFADRLSTRGAAPFGARAAMIHAALLGQHADALAARAAFDARVRGFFAAHDSARLLEFDVFSGDGWDRLCGFLGRPVPAAAFPWDNKTPNRRLD